MKSIIVGNRKGTCWLCGREGTTEEHHIFGGTRNRKLSGRYGLTVYLCPRCHRDSREGVHADSGKMLLLHRTGQRAFEEGHSRQDFVQIFGRNYLEETADPRIQGKDGGGPEGGCMAAGSPAVGGQQAAGLPGEGHRAPDGITWMEENRWTN